MATFTFSAAVNEILIADGIKFPSTKIEHRLTFVRDAISRIKNSHKMRTARKEMTNELSDAYIAVMGAWRAIEKTLVASQDMPVSVDRPYLNAKVSAFFSERAVKIPNYNIKQFPSFVDGAINHILEIKNELESMHNNPDNPPIPSEYIDALDSLLHEWDTVRTKLTESMPDRPPVFDFKAWSTLHPEVQRPDAMIVETPDDCQAKIDAINQAILEGWSSEGRDGKIRYHVLPPRTVDMLESYINGWTAIKYKYGAEFGATTGLAAKPAEYVAKKAEKAAESRQVREEMQKRKK